MPFDPFRPRRSRAAPPATLAWLLLTLLAASTASAKRAAPAAVPPVVHEGVRYEAPHWASESPCGQTGGCVAAYDAQSGALRWHVTLYAEVQDPKLERDVQDVFITRLSISGGQLRATDERRRRWAVDLNTHRVSRDDDRVCAVTGTSLGGAATAVVALRAWRRRRGARTSPPRT